MCEKKGKTKAYGGNKHKRNHEKPKGKEQKRDSKNKNGSKEKRRPERETGHGNNEKNATRKARKKGGPE